ncbi:MAG: hypothetical protein R3236_02775 [Phycisphaeraceae bacterium]|nr:hypothetical protein [Phycisphaeraceae bacterium]
MIQAIQNLLLGLTALAMGAGPAFCPCPDAEAAGAEVPACHASGSESSRPCHDSSNRDGSDQNRFCCHKKITPIASTDKLSIPMADGPALCSAPEPVEPAEQFSPAATRLARSTHGPPGVPRTLLSLGCLLTT